MTRSPLALMALAALAGLTAACVSVLPEAGPPPSIYRLSLHDVATPPKFGSTVLEIALPSSSRVLANNRVAVMEETGSLAYLEGARWAAPVPRLIQMSASAHLSTAPRLKAVVLPEDGVPATAELRLKIEAFEFAAGEREGRIALAATLIDTTSRNVIGSARFAQAAPATGSRDRDAINALDTATEAVMIDIRDWTVDLLR